MPEDSLVVDGALGVSVLVVEASVLLAVVDSGSSSITLTCSTNWYNFTVALREEIRTHAKGE